VICVEDVTGVTEKVENRDQLLGDPIKYCCSLRSLTMSERRFPPPWSVEEQDGCFVVRELPRVRPVSITDYS
jgi:hypothetical protein